MSWQICGLFDVPKSTPTQAVHVKPPTRGDYRIMRASQSTLSRCPYGVQDSSSDSCTEDPVNGRVCRTTSTEESSVVTMKVALGSTWSTYGGRISLYNVRRSSRRLLPNYKILQSKLKQHFATQTYTL